MSLLQFNTYFGQTLTIFQHLRLRISTLILKYGFYRHTESSGYLKSQGQGRGIFSSFGGDYSLARNTDLVG